MECLKNRAVSEKFHSMSLKHSLFTLTLGNLLATALNSNCIGAVREVGYGWNA